MILRDYDGDDAAEICHLFFGTVRSVILANYSPEQVRAWTPAPPDPVAWHERMSGRHTLLAEQDGEVVGFAELEGDGHLDMLYCRHDAVDHGVGARPYEAVEDRARELGLRRTFAEASITARSSSAAASRSSTPTRSPGTASS